MKVIQKGAALPPMMMSTQLIHTYRRFFLSFLSLCTLPFLSHLMTLLSNARPWCCFEVLCTEGGLSLWISTWACSCPLYSTRRPRSSRSASSFPPGTWRSLALMPRQRWAMVRCVQSTFGAGRGSAGLGMYVDSPSRVARAHPCALIPLQRPGFLHTRVLA